MGDEERELGKMVCIERRIPRAKEMIRIGREVYDRASKTQHRLRSVWIDLGEGENACPSNRTARSRDGVSPVSYAVG
jgi:hypothetical protein